MICTCNNALACHCLASVLDYGNEERLFFSVSAWMLCCLINLASGTETSGDFGALRI